MMIVSLLFYSIVGYNVTWFLYYVGHFVYVYFLAKPRNLKKLAKSDWAAVTGCTQGIGYAYARECAKHGFNVLLLSRSLDKLKVIKEEFIEEFPHLQFEVLDFDFSSTDAKEYEEKLKGPLEKVGLLVNNVGHAPAWPEYLHRIPNGLDNTQQTVAVNCLATSLLCQMVVQPMSKRGGGIVVNISSILGLHSFPMVVTYSASKSFINRLTSNLRREYPSITWQVITPGWIKTQMSKCETTTWKILTPEQYAKSAISTVGVSQNNFGHWAHQLDFSLIGFLPEILTNPMILKAMKQKRLESISQLEIYKIKQK